MSSTIPIALQTLSSLLTQIDTARTQLDTLRAQVHTLTQRVPAQQSSASITPSNNRTLSLAYRPRIPAAEPSPPPAQRLCSVRARGVLHCEARGADPVIEVEVLDGEIEIEGGGGKGRKWRVRGGEVVGWDG
jgi:uncharacterized coiled-coil protein SlyX